MEPETSQTKGRLPKTHLWHLDPSLGYVWKISENLLYFFFFNSASMAC